MAARLGHGVDVRAAVVLHGEPVDHACGRHPRRRPDHAAGGPRRHQPGRDGGRRGGRGDGTRGSGGARRQGLDAHGAGGPHLRRGGRGAVGRARPAHLGRPARGAAVRVARASSPRDAVGHGRGHHRDLLGRAARQGGRPHRRRPHGARPRADRLSGMGARQRRRVAAPGLRHPRARPSPIGAGLAIVLRSGRAPPDGARLADLLRSGPTARAGRP